MSARGIPAVTGGDGSHLKFLIAEPGVIRHIEGNRISVGELDGSRSDRARPIAEALIKSGLRAPVTACIRRETE